MTIYENRELSWLRFNERVLEEAASASVPLGERLSFLSIFQSNLDEFFMVRVGSLTDRAKTAPGSRDSKTDMTPEQQLEAIMKEVRRLCAKKDEIYARVMAELREYGIQLINFSSLSEEDASFLEKYFKKEIRPLLAPQIISKRQPFPFLRGKEIYAVVALSAKKSKNGKSKHSDDDRENGSGKKKSAVKLGIVPCNSQMFPKLIKVPGREETFMLADELILHFMPKIFKGYDIAGKSLVRIIRNADIDMDDADFDDSTDYRRDMEKILKNRRKLAPVKVDYSRFMGSSVIALLCSYLGFSTERAFHSESPLDMSVTGMLRDVLKEKDKNIENTEPDRDSDSDGHEQNSASCSEPRRNKLFYNRLVPQQSAYIDPKRSMVEQIKEKDVMLAYPYESIDPFIRLLSEAAFDPKVVSVRITLYRVADDSRIVRALEQAAENGKDVLVLVELRARFDEEHNIECSRALESAGCRIIYGFDHFKVHSKLCQIVRQGDEGLEYITQVGTGNYNEKTAGLYTDLCMMTASPDIAEDASHVFDALSLGILPDGMHTLMVAPNCLQDRVIDLIDREIKKAENNEPAYIGLKMNSLSDKKIIDELIKASQAGVTVDMVIRGICCLMPGVPGYTENIHVRSIVGRYLEHARIYIFGAEPETCDIYIASADFMTRNTVNRVEVAAPVLDKDIRKRVLDMFDTMLADNVKAWIKQPDGSYIKASEIKETSKLPSPAEQEEAQNAAGAPNGRAQSAPPAETKINSQEEFFKRAYNRTL